MPDNLNQDLNSQPEQSPEQHSNVKTLVSHPTFQMLSPDAQRKALTHLDADFGSMHPNEQDKFIRTYGAPAAHSDVEMKGGSLGHLGPEDIDKLNDQSSAYTPLPGVLGRGEDWLNKKVVAPFRKGLDVIGSDLSNDASSGHTSSGYVLNRPQQAVMGGVGALMKYGVPVGSNLRETAGMAIVPPGLSPEAKEAWATERLAQVNKDIKPMTIESMPGEEPGSLVAHLKQGDKTLSSLDATKVKTDPENIQDTAQIGMAYTDPFHRNMGLASHVARFAIDRLKKEGISKLRTGSIMTPEGAGLVKKLGENYPLIESMKGSFPEGELDLANAKDLSEPLHPDVHRALDAELDPKKLEFLLNDAALRKTAARPITDVTGELNQSVANRAAQATRPATTSLLPAKPLEPMSAKSPRLSQVLNNEMKASSPLKRRVLTDLTQDTEAHPSSIMDIPTLGHDQTMTDSIKNMQRAHLADTERQLPGAGRASQEALKEVDAHGDLKVSTPREEQAMTEAPLPKWWTQGKATPQDAFGAFDLTRNQPRYNVLAKPDLSSRQPNEHFYDRTRSIVRDASPALRQRLFHELEGIDTHPDSVMNFQPRGGGGDNRLDQAMGDIQKAYLANMEHNRPGLGRLMSDSINEVNSGNVRLGSPSKVMADPLSESIRPDSPFHIKSPESPARPFGIEPPGVIPTKTSAKAVSPEEAVKAAGAKHVGRMGDLHLFNDPETGSTLALPPDKMNAATIKQHLAESRAEFNKYKKRVN